MMKRTTGLPYGVARITLAITAQRHSEFRPIWYQVVKHIILISEFTFYNPVIASSSKNIFRRNY